MSGYGEATLGYKGGPSTIRQLFHLDRTDRRHQVNMVTGGSFQGVTLATHPSVGGDLVGDVCRQAVVAAVCAMATGVSGWWRVGRRRG